MFNTCENTIVTQRLKDNVLFVLLHQPSMMNKRLNEKWNELKTIEETGNVKCF